MKKQEIQLSFILHKINLTVKFPCKISANLKICTVLSYIQNHKRKMLSTMCFWIMDRQIFKPNSQRILLLSSIPEPSYTDRRKYSSI